MDTSVILCINRDYYRQSRSTRDGACNGTELQFT
uniref:Uncharacterized protein n=1 Tax=Arundo donax TaxID=35708 RepID=A0A0A9C635_ARUDO